MKKIIPIIGTLFILSCKKKQEAIAPAPFLNLPGTTLELSPLSNASAEVIIESNIEWQLSFSSGTDWLKADKTSGNGNDTIHVTVLTDNTDSQSRTSILTVFSVSSATNLKAQLTVKQKNYNVQLPSEKVLGGNSRDELDGVVSLSDGGMFLAGYTSSNQSGTVGKNHGSYDGWLVRLNSNFDTLWTRVMGGTGVDVLICATATKDGNYLVAGYTSAANGDVTGTIAGKDDWWIMKLNDEGDTIWTRLVGGAFNDFPRSVTTTADGGYLVVGQTGITSSETDAMVVKLDADGNLVWQKRMGGTGTDVFNAVYALDDGNIMLAGSTSSNGTGDISVSHGKQDAWVVKLNASGEVLWNRLYGGLDNDEAYALSTTPDGGYIFAGATNSNETGDVGVTNGNRDIWAVRLNTSGDTVFTSILGGSGADYSRGIITTTDGGYVITGYSNSTDGIMASNHGDYDTYATKINNSGQMVWFKPFGGLGYDYANTLTLNADNSITITGYTESNSSGDVGAGFGSGDAWVYKIKDF